MHLVFGWIARRVRHDLVVVSLDPVRPMRIHSPALFRSQPKLPGKLDIGCQREYRRKAPFRGDNQQLNMALKYAPKPVVAAPFAMALGGGCETPLRCARIQASAELLFSRRQSDDGAARGPG
jgi:hypothetical protein